MVVVRKRAKVFFAVIAVVIVITVASVLIVLYTAKTETGISLQEYAKQPFGDVLIMRHATAPGSGDPEGFVLEECSTQRELDIAGLEQASDVGRKLAASTLKLAPVVYSSQWCRCFSTARQLIAPLNEKSSLYSVYGEWGLNSFYEERGGFTKDRCMQQLNTALLDRLRDAATEDRNELGNVQTLLVTHKVTVFEVTGIQVESGEIVAFDTKSGEAKRLVL